MAQQASGGPCHSRAQVQQRAQEWERVRNGTSSSSSARKFCHNSSPKEQQPSEQPEQQRPMVSLPSLATPQSLLAPMTANVHHLAEAARSESDDNEDCGCSFSSAGAVARFEMEEESALGESDDGGSSSCSSSAFANSCGGGRTSDESGSSRSSIGSGRGTLPAWGARSKLPFHMLPFEVQAYHLQQQQKLRQSRKHSRNAGSTSIMQDRSSSSSSSSGHRADSRPEQQAPVHAADEEEGDEAEEQSAVVESAWFPLMPPAMAGETRPAAASPGTGAEEHVEISSSDDTRGVTLICSGQDAVGRGSTGVRRDDAPRLEGNHQGNEYYWAGAAGDVVHLTALQFPRGTSINSTATTASTSSATLSSAGSCEAYNGCEDGGARAEIGASPRRWTPAAWPAHSPLPPTEPPSTTAAPAGGAESTAAVATVGEHRRPAPAAAAAATVFFGGALDDPRRERNAALTLSALSGFAPLGAATLQAVCLDLSSACRALAAWSLRVVVDSDADRSQLGGSDHSDVGRRGRDDLDTVVTMPPQLAEHIWPRSSDPRTVRRQRSLGSGEINASTGRDTSTTVSNSSRRHATAGATTTATPNRLARRRWITRVRVESTGRRRGGVTLASWPATMLRLEFGDRFNSPVEGISLPEGLEVVKFGPRFNQPVSRIRWPSTLRELSFGNDFNQPVSGIDLPPGVRRLDFGGRFNFVVSAVDLPEELRELRFGHGFNREIASVRWPPKLSKLEFCGELQQKIEEVAWPGSLTHLALLGDFDQPVHAVQWPSGLVTIRFGDRFQQPLAGVTSWPPRLETVVLGTRYGKSLSGCVLLPSPDGESAGGLQLQVRRTDGGDGGGSVAGAGSKVGAPDKHPSLVDAFLRVVVSRGDDGHTGDDSSCVGIDDACCGDPSTMAVRHAEEPTLHAVEVWDQHRLPMEGGVPDEEEMLSVGDVGTDADVDHERYWDEDDADGGGDGQGLPYVDVFEVEDVAWDWDVEDPCLSLPGTY